MELETLRTEDKAKQNQIIQLQLKHNGAMQTLDKEKNDMTKIKITSVKMLDSTQPIKDLEQQIKNVRKEKNEIELQLRDTNQKLVKAVRKTVRFEKANADSSQMIEKLIKEKEKMKTEKKALQSKLDTQSNETIECDQGKAERDQLSSKNELLHKKVNELQLKCKYLQEEITKSKNFVSRKYQLSFIIA